MSPFVDGRVRSGTLCKDHRVAVMPKRGAGEAVAAIDLLDVGESCSQQLDGNYIVWDVIVYWKSVIVHLRE